MQFIERILLLIINFTITKENILFVAVRDEKEKLPKTDNAAGVEKSDIEVPDKGGIDGARENGTVSSKKSDSKNADNPKASKASVKNFNKNNVDKSITVERLPNKSLGNIYTIDQYITNTKVDGLQVLHTVSLDNFPTMHSLNFYLHRFAITASAHCV